MLNQGGVLSIRNHSGEIKRLRSRNRARRKCRISREIKNGRVFLPHGRELSPKSPKCRDAEQCFRSPNNYGPVANHLDFADNVEIYTDAAKIEEALNLFQELGANDAQLVAEIANIVTSGGGAPEVLTWKRTASSSQGRGGRYSTYD